MHDKPTAWEETGAVRPLAHSTTSSLALRTDTTPSSDDDRMAFADALGPCLALVAPTGMVQTERRAWMEAAFAALRHLPIDVIEKGATEARKTADHPSKIVPAIIAATEAEISWRRRNSAPRPQPEAALPSPGGERCTPAELDAICKQFSVGRYAKEHAASPHAPTTVAATADPERTCRKPTREDYIRLFGVDPEAPPAAPEAEAA